MARVSEAETSRERSPPLSSAVLSPGSLPLVPQPPAPHRGRKAPCREGGSLDCTPATRTSCVCSCPSPDTGGEGGSEGLELPNPVCLPLYERDTYSPCGMAKSQFHFQGPLVPLQILTPPEPTVEGLSQHTHVHGHTARAFPTFIFFLCGSSLHSNHFTLFSAIPSSFVPTSSTTRESLGEQPGVSPSPLG